MQFRRLTDATLAESGMAISRTHGIGERWRSWLEFQNMAESHQPRRTSEKRKLVYRAS
jgi:hypothetical protein